MKMLSRVLYVVAALSLVSFLLVGAILKGFAPFMWIALALCVLSLAAGMYLDRKVLSEFLAAKTTKSGMSMGVMILLAVVLLVAVNFLGARKYKTFDFSATRVNSLSDQSIQVVKDLKSDVKVYYFYKDSDQVEARKRAFTDLLRKYQDETSKLKLEFVDLNERPDLTNQFGVVSGVETVWIEYEGRRAKMEKVDEQELTSAIVKVTREKEKVVYFTSGHGELPFEKKEDGLSMQALKELLQTNRYSVRNLNFDSSFQIPSDADVVWILGPKQMFTGAELKSFEEYLARGGQLVLALDPKTTHGLTPLVQKAGIKLQDNLIVTALELGGTVRVDPRAVRGNVYGSTPITKPFSRNESTLFSLPQSLGRVTPAPVGINLEDVLRTTGQSMAFRDTQAFSKPEQALKESERGPFVLGLLAKGKWPKEAGTSEKEFSLVVYGSSLQFSDALLYGSLNRDLALNTVSFLAKEESAISITPKDVTRTKMELSPTQFWVYFFLLILPLPLLLFSMSGFMWWRRRSA